MEDVVRYFKKCTSKKLPRQITIDPKSRRKWLFNYFEFSAMTDAKNTNFKVWQDGNLPIEVRSEQVVYLKKYMHKNPIVHRIVEKEED